jgi:hypothetical protein
VEAVGDQRKFVKFRSRWTLIVVAAAAVVATGIGLVNAANASYPLARNYAFTGLSSDWAVYDTTHSKAPSARVPSLVTVSGGALHVATVGAKGSGLCLCRNTGKPTKPYGRWDIRARASKNADHGFAMLLWPNAENWPVGGEIDLAEYPDAARSRVQATVHYGAKNREYVGFLSGSFTTWHTYSVVWTSTSIIYSVDGRRFLTVHDRAAIPKGAMHLVLQAGANSGIRAAADTRATLDVDWVKVYR